MCRRPRGSASEPSGSILMDPMHHFLRPPGFQHLQPQVTYPSTVSFSGHTLSLRAAPGQLCTC